MQNNPPIPYEHSEPKQKSGGWLRRKLRAWLGLDKMEARMIDIERHFVTRRNQQGDPIETLADVPIEQRKERQARTRGMSIQQRIAWAERTDGGRIT